MLDIMRINGVMPISSSKAVESEMLDQDQRICRDRAGIPNEVKDKPRSRHMLVRCEEKFICLL